MSHAFFKIADNAKLLLGDGSYLTFKETGDVGTLIVGKPYYLEQIRSVIARGVGGVEEISEAEYQMLQKKKTLSLPRDLRERVSVQQFRDALRNRAGASRVGDGRGSGLAERFQEKGTISAIEYKPVIPGFKPNSIKR